MNAHNLKQDDVVVIRAFDDDWPEHLFKVSEVYDDCITGHAITGPQPLSGLMTTTITHHQ